MKLGSLRLIQQHDIESPQFRVMQVMQALIDSLTLLRAPLLPVCFDLHLRKAGLRSRSILVSLNIAVAVTWCCYFLAVQLIEPAIVFTIFSGMAQPLRNEQPSQHHR